ncbi:MAG: FecR family protein [Spirochaetia bacterium]|nr:FecR family protein [Spirochaetia bacterium]
MKDNEEKLNDEFVKQLSNIKEAPHLSEEKKKELWQKILIRSEKEAAIKPNKGYYNYMAKAASVIAVISAAFFIFNEITKEKEIILTYKQNETIKNINLNNTAYSTNDSFIEGTIDKNISIWSGNMQELKASIENKNLVLNIKSGILVLKKNSKNNNYNHLQIKTPTAQIFVKGTEFLLDVSEENTLVAVKEGEIKIKKDTIEKDVKQGTFWQSSDVQTIQEADNNELENLFSGIKNKKDLKPDIETLKEFKARWMGKKVTIKLNNGKNIFGSIIKEEKTKIVIKSGIAKPLSIDIVDIQSINEGFVQ